MYHGEWQELLLFFLRWTHCRSRNFLHERSSSVTDNLAAEVHPRSIRTERTAGMLVLGRLAFLLIGLQCFVCYDMCFVVCSVCGSYLETFSWRRGMDIMYGWIVNSKRCENSCRGLFQALFDLFFFLSLWRSAREICVGTGAFLGRPKTKQTAVIKI